MNMIVLRLAAVAIAVLAVVDPAMTSSRTSRPMVSIVPTSAGETALANRISAALEQRFTVIRGRLDGTAGTVLVGTTLPDESTSWTGPLVGVAADPMSPAVKIFAIEAPSEVPLDARVPVLVQVASAGARGRTLEVALRADHRLVDTATVVLDADTNAVSVKLTFLPAVSGAAHLTAVARVVGTSSMDSASTVVESRDQRYSVLFFDPRASWNSTFVRRTVEADPRFIVTSRVQTSRGVANVSGRAPTSLRGASLREFTTIVVGSPDQLTEGDVTALEDYMRTRGGRVVILLDGRVTDNINRFTGVARWSSLRLENPAVLVDSSGSNSLRARELAWPTVPPAGISMHVWNRASDSSMRPILWSVPVGAGRLFVSGALDAWHHRDPGTSRFDVFWPRVMADLSAASPQQLEIALPHRVLVPGQHITFRVTVRDAALSNDQAISMRATLTNGTESTFVRTWPTRERGTMEGAMVAPPIAGTYRLVVNTGFVVESAAVVVDPGARPATPDQGKAFTAFVSSRGGFTITESQLQDLPDRLTAAFRPVSRVESWYPMRSAWWLIPFTALLGAEWWWRRRRGLA